MRLCTHIEGIKAEVDKNKLAILSNKPLRVLSSAVLNGGLTKATEIINIHVPEGCDVEIHEDPESFLKKTAKNLGLTPTHAVGIMTAADVRNVEVLVQKHQKMTLVTFTTAGVGYSAMAGEATISKTPTITIEKTGTINIVLIVDGYLTDSCMVDAVKTVTEAKTVALRELDVRSRFSGDPASGTVTDSVVVACTRRGKPIKYAGTATTLGELISKSVRESTKKAITRQTKMTADRPIAERLKERGISPATITDLIFEIAPSNSVNSEKLRKSREELQQILSDSNLTTLIEAALRLDEDIRIGLIPNGRHDKSWVCDILHTAVHDYLCGKNKTQKYPRFEDEISPNSGRLGVFTKSVLMAVINSICSDTYTK